MVAKIMSSRSAGNAIMYNEEKLKEGRAECLDARNFLKEVSHLTVDDKIRCFERRLELNEKVTTIQHITLNFDPADNLPSDKMKEIAGKYMEEIGFGRQPYLVYRHNDAGHPHCHIVTTHVRSDGQPIPMYNIGKGLSEKARKHLESKYDLTTAEKKRELRTLPEKPAQSQKPDRPHNQDRPQKQDRPQNLRIKYGEKSTAKAISDVLNHVVPNYKYTSLKELNTVLRQYNVEAYRGNPDSKLFNNRGLLYRVLDDRGKYVGVPVKASFFDSKPTLNNLQLKFVQNLTEKQQNTRRTLTNVQYQMVGSKDNLQNVIQNLSRDGISMVIDLHKDGSCKDVSYIDRITKCIFSGEELGARANREAIQKIMDRERLHPQQTPTQEQHQRHSLRM
jgi:Relaxase/Mobilisation nuclease domain